MKSPVSKSTLHVHACMLLTILLASSSFPVGKAITHGMPPMILMLLRFVIGALLFAPYIFMKYGIKGISLKDLVRYAVLSIPLVIFFPAMFESLRFTSALNTGALYTLVPGITAIYALIMNKEKVGKVKMIGLLIGVVGALWINFRGDLDSLLRFDFNKGDLIFLAGCLSLAFYNPLVKRLYRNEPMEVMTFWTLTTGSVWLLILSGTDIWTINWIQIEPKIYGGVVYLAFFSTLCTFFLMQYSTVRIGATKSAAYSYLTPVFVLCIDLLIGKNIPVLPLFPGILLVILAMLLIQRENKGSTPLGLIQPDRQTERAG